MANQEVTLVALAQLWAKGRISLEQAVQLASRVDEPKVIHEHEGQPYGGRAHEGNHNNSFAAVMGLVDDVLTMEQAHEFVAAVAAARASR